MITRKGLTRQCFSLDRKRIFRTETSRAEHGRVQPDSGGESLVRVMYARLLPSGEGTPSLHSKTSNIPPPPRSAANIARPPAHGNRPTSTILPTAPSPPRESRPIRSDG